MNANTTPTATVAVSNMVKGDTYTVDTNRKGAIDTVTGVFISVNTKGINLNVDGRTVSRSLAAVVRVTRPVATPDVPADLFTDGVVYTTAAVAAALDMSAYDLRVVLRSLGMGVGKGRRYGFDAGDARTVYTAVRAGQNVDNS